MDPTHSPLKHKRSFSTRAREKWNKFIGRSRSPSPSRQQSPRVPSVQSASQPPSPSEHSSLTPHIGLAPALAPQATATPPGSVRASPQAPGIGTPTLVGPGNDLPTIVVSDLATDSSGKEQASGDPATPVGSVSTNQPTSSALWAGLGIALQGLHKNACLFPPLQSAIDAFIPCLDILEEAARSRKEYDELASELTTLVGLLAQHIERSNNARMSDSIINVARSIKEQAKLIESRRARSTRRRLMEAGADEEELGKYYRRIGSLFQQLQADANLSIWSIVNDQMANTRLERLKPAMLARYDSLLSGGISRRTCTANTRTAILSGLNGWSRDPDGADLYWMNGMAGTGKTTIACSFSESLEERKQLAASFFCTRTVPECREVSRIIPTIAYQFARYSFPFHSALCEALGEDPDISSKNLTKQFERLLKTPLLKVKEAIPNDLVVVIDALDECDDMREVELLLTILLKSVAELPIKFFITSRPEPEIYDRMLARGHGSRATLHLHEVEKSLVQADIEVYLEEELEFMSPATAQIKELARRSGNLFIYAATLVRYIRCRKPQTDPEWRLQAVLDMTSESTKQYATIDALYAAVLKAALDDDSEDLEAHEVDDVRRVLQTVICAQEPVSVDVLAVLAGVEKERRVLSVLQSLRSVLHFSETTGLVSTLHASFPDFMFDKTRSKSFSCNFAECSQVLAQRCFEVMKAQLKFNICRLESSFVPDSQVDNLEERVKQAISPALWYACRYWGGHLRQSVYSDSLCTSLNDFLSDRLLFWIEVLNLKHGTSLGAEVLLKAKQWLKIDIVPPDVARLTEDARNFVTSFAANPVSQCTPHIYISLLPFCSKSSSVFKQYWKKTRGLINVTGSAMQRRGWASLASWKTESEVLSVAYSPDGSWLAVGCGDGTVSVRSARDGTLVAGPFKGHTAPIRSVAYSPDGTRIVSGSDDHTIRVWNAQDGTLVAGPFEGHTHSVLSAAYSPDGAHIVSGSRDGTIRVWSAQDGTLIAGPFKGHTDRVQSVAYSPDGTRIVSGSDDRTIRVWSAQDGTLVAGPFKGHTRSVRRVVYSPDGTCIVSGSDDRTIRVWSAQDGMLVTGPFKGHTNSVWSVAYSPDGTYIVSGSHDHTIRVWNARDGTLVAVPFEGHTNFVQSVAYSPDGTRIISGSFDCTIRVWSAQDGTLVAGEFEGHTDRTLSVALSPDGTCIVSGSNDRTLRVWSAQDGTLVAGPFEGHTEWIESVAYSPDGTHIISGSHDRTIRVWNVQDSTLAAGPFKGHANTVRSVAYSPDARCIVSGSDDCTLRIWGALDGTLIVSPLRGHGGSVYSVAYSPDGTRIVSGSSDCTIRVWSAQDGVLIAGPFEGHTDFVWSVAFSPNSTCIVSGSNDCTIRVWSAQDGTLIAGPFEGHTDLGWSVAYPPDGTYVVSGSDDCTTQVCPALDDTPQAVVSSLRRHSDPAYSVTYSPDGTHIVSGSDDYTIQAWDALDDTPVVSPRRSPGGAVYSVAYSPDGRHIVSGSYACTIQIWSAHDGTLVAGPFKGHTQSVHSVAYSPDGTRIVSSSDDTIRVWRTLTGSLLNIQPVHTQGGIGVASPSLSRSSSTSHSHTTDLPNQNIFSDQWAIRHDGWVVNAVAQLIFWLPPEFSQTGVLPTLSNPLIITSHGSLIIDYSDVFLGSFWDKIYRPE